MSDMNLRNTHLLCLSLLFMAYSLQKWEKRNTRLNAYIRERDIEGHNGVPFCELFFLVQQVNHLFLISPTKVVCSIPQFYYQSFWLSLYSYLPPPGSIWIFSPYPYTLISPHPTMVHIHNKAIKRKRKITSHAL